MIRAGAVACLLAASPTGAQTLVGDWHCLQDGADVRIEAEARFTRDGAFTAQMEYRFVRPVGTVLVRAVYAASWHLDGTLFRDEPLDARITSVTLDGQDTDLPDLSRAILSSLLEPPDSPMQIAFDGPDLMFLRGGGGGTPYECLRLGQKTDL